MQFLGHGIKSILLAEDDDDDQEMLIAAFSEIDPTVIVVRVPNGRKILSYLENISDAELPSLIILDYNLPEMNGAEIMSLLQQRMRYRNIPKIIWSTSASPVYRSLCMSLGAKEYMIKPSNMAAYLATARHMLTFIGETML